MPQAHTSSSGLFGSVLMLILVIAIIIFIVGFIIALIGCLFRTAKATEETQRLLERLLKVTEAVAKTEHPELYKKKESTGEQASEPEKEQPQPEQATQEASE